MKYHILGIAGVMTAPIAFELKKQGHFVSGSDQEKIYPPISDQLTDIPLNSHSDFLNADIYIIGTSVHRFALCQQEYDYILKNNLPYISSTEFLAKNLIKPESILVAGSYGKTTISAFLSWLFDKLNLNPSYFFGGTLVESFPSFSISNGEFSIVEADESINGLDTQAKFLYYPAKYLILTSAQWEHKDSYKTATDNFNAFKQLVKKLPLDGILVYNPHDSEITKLLPFCSAKKIPYQNFDFKTQLIGSYNHENINAALTLCQSLNFDLKSVTSIIPEFSGIKRRLEIINQQPLIIDDFAQSPERIKSAMDAIFQTFPNRPIKVFFEPHATFLQNKSSLKNFRQAFTLADKIILGKIKFNPNYDKNNRTTADSYRLEIGNKLIYLPISDDIIKYLQNDIQPNDILVHMSSGGNDGFSILKSIINSFNSRRINV